MQTITTIGFDIAKSIFQVHCVDAEGKVILRRQLKRRYVLAFFQKLPRCLVGIEACATSRSVRYSRLRLPTVTFTEVAPLREAASFPWKQPSRLFVLLQI
jgi:transposase